MEENPFEKTFLDLSAKTYLEEHASAYRAALAVVSSAVSPELAGTVYYKAASASADSLPYTLDDCKKLSSLLLSQDSAFGSDALDRMIAGEYNGVNERQATTALRSVSASLRKAIGISQSAKNYLYTLAEEGFDRLLAASDLGEENLDAAQQAKDLVLRLVAALRDRYDLIVTYAAEYLSAADARLILGLPYEK